MEQFTTAEIDAEIAKRKNSKNIPSNFSIDEIDAEIKKRLSSKAPPTEDVTSKFNEIPTIQGGTSYEVPKQTSLLGRLGQMALLDPEAKLGIPYEKAPTVKEVATEMMPKTKEDAAGLIGGAILAPLGPWASAGGAALGGGAAKFGSFLAGKSSFADVVKEMGYQGGLDVVGSAVGYPLGKAANKIAEEATGGLFKDLAGKASTKTVSEDTYRFMHDKAEEGLKNINLTNSSFDKLSFKEGDKLVKQKMEEHGISQDPKLRGIYERVFLLSWFTDARNKKQAEEVSKAATSLMGGRLSDSEKIALVDKIKISLGKALETEKGFIETIAKRQEKLKESQLKNVDKESLDSALKFFFGDANLTYKDLGNPVKFANELVNLKRQAIYQDELKPAIQNFTKDLASKGKNIYPELPATQKMFKKYDIERNFKVGTGGPIEELLTYIKTDKNDLGVSPQVMDLVSGDPNLEQWMIEKYGKNIRQYDPTEIVRIVTSLNDKISEVPNVSNYAKQEIRHALKEDLSNFFRSNGREDLANLYKSKLTEYGDISDKIDSIKNLAKKSPKTLFEHLTPDGVTNIKNTLAEIPKEKSDQLLKQLQQGHATYITGLDEPGGITVKEMQDRAFKLGKTGLDELWGKDAKDVIKFLDDAKLKSETLKKGIEESVPKLPIHNEFFQRIVETKGGLTSILPDLLKNPKQIPEIQGLIGKDYSKKLVDAFNDHLFSLSSSGTFDIKGAAKIMEDIETDHVKHEAMKNIFKGKEEQFAAIKDFIYTVSKGARGAQDVGNYFYERAGTGAVGMVSLYLAPGSIAPIMLGAGALQYILHNPGLTKKLGQAMTGQADKKILDELSKIAVKSTVNNSNNFLNNLNKVPAKENNNQNRGMLERALTSNYGQQQR